MATSGVAAQYIGSGALWQPMGQVSAVPMTYIYIYI